MFGNDPYVKVSLLSVPSTWISVYGVLLFRPKKPLEKRSADLVNFSADLKLQVGAVRILN